MERMFDSRFRNFNEQMEKNRQLMLKQMDTERKQLTTGKQEGGQLAKRPEEGQLMTQHSYTKQNRMSESRAVQVGKYRIMYKLVDETRERDGISLPHIVRQINCHPAAPMNILSENSIFEETLGEGKSQRILSQFERDTKNVTDIQKPHLIMKYVNTILQDDPADMEKGKIYTLKITYLNKDNERYRYTYRLRQGEAQGQSNIERSSKLFSSFFW